MEKQQEASAPPNFGDAPPPYPGTGVGGFAPPPAAGKNYVYFITMRISDYNTYIISSKTISNLKVIDCFQVNMHHRLANIPLSHQDTFKDSPLPNHPRNR